MKVRIDASGFRFRLGAEEVHSLSHEENVEMEVGLGRESMVFVLGTIVDEWPVCSLEAGRLFIHLPAVWFVNWAENDVSGFEFDLDGDGLKVVVEKDYPCNHGASGESAYPPPRKMPSAK